MNPHIKNYLNTLKLNHQEQGLGQLTEFIQSHLKRFPFSSINASGDALLSLDTAPLFRRLIVDNQGGYCFEHNKIAYLALQALGYQVKAKLARVTLNGASDNPRTHRISLVTFDGQDYAVDVGFGVQSPIIPINVSTSGTVNDGNITYKVTRDCDKVRVEKTAPRLLSLFEIDLADAYEGDFEMSHFYSHQHPSAAFVNNLVVSRIEPSQRWLIKNHQFQILNQKAEIVHDIVIDSEQALSDTLHRYFNLSVSPSRLKVLFTRFVLPRIEASAA